MHLAYVNAPIDESLPFSMVVESFGDTAKSSLGPAFSALFRRNDLTRQSLYPYLQQKYVSQQASNSSDELVKEEAFGVQKNMNTNKKINKNNNSNGAAFDTLARLATQDRIL